MLCIGGIELEVLRESSRPAEGPVYDEYPVVLVFDHVADAPELTRSRTVRSDGCQQGSIGSVPVHGRPERVSDQEIAVACLGEHADLGKHALGGFLKLCSGPFP